MRGPGTRLAALVDASGPARAWAGETFHVPVFGRLEQALESVEADAVLLVSPPATHRPLAEASLTARRHVVVEKPLAPTLGDAEALAEAAERAGLHVMAAQNYRFRRQSRALQRLVSTGVLGGLLAIRIACRRDLRGVAFAARDWRVTMQHPYLLDMAIHHVDMLRQITGREIVAADARAWRVPDSPFEHEPSVEALLTLAGGTPVAYEGTWAGRGRRRRGTATGSSLERRRAPPGRAVFGMRSAVQCSSSATANGPSGSTCRGFPPSIGSRCCTSYGARSRRGPHPSAPPSTTSRACARSWRSPARRRMAGR